MVRVAVLYGLAAWLILQVAEVLFGLLDLPTWAGKLVLGLLVLGFPLVLIFSWVYELTPEGLKREHEVERHQSITRETGRKINYLIGALAAIAIVMIVAERFVPRAAPNPGATQAGAPSASAPVLAATKSIAVLPFADMSEGKDQEYFADGLSEELLNLLAKIPDLRVAARTSAFKFKGEKVDLQDVARKLNVSHVLEGSVRRSGNKVRITAQLIKASDGYHVWSQTYDRTLDDIFVVQDDIAGEVVKALKLTLLGTTSATRSRPTDPEAYNLALQGRFFVGRRSKEDLERAVDYFQRSRERDPGYAPAWAGLSQAYARQADGGFLPIADGHRQARGAAEKALALDPQLVDAHLAMGWIQLSHDLDWAAADASYRTALDLEPGNAEALRHGGWLAGNLGHWDEAIDLMHKAIERDPLRPNSYTYLGYLFLAVERDSEAEAAFRKALELDPDGAARHRTIGLALLLQGKTDAALREMQQETDEGWRLAGLPLVFHALGRRGESDAALAALKDKYAGDSAYQIAEVHAFRGEAALAFEWLERAYAQRDAGVPEIKCDRLMRGLVGDPRYKAFLRKLKLPE
ncbi:tetratricopeptide repeat protein [Lysobacter niastensis]|uniref:tetratricopeptide repeat protein n=1 Tax=Lysobacter niastensis TaxID=380629 RepID=UPI00286BF109|nr:tetratricopeptide repeat protein [Lysobacter niastensis]